MQKRGLVSADWQNHAGQWDADHFGWHHTVFILQPDKQALSADVYIANGMAFAFILHIGA